MKYYSARAFACAMLMVVLWGGVQTQCVQAQSASQAGNSPISSLYSFLRTEPSARAAGMGGTLVAVPNDAAGLFVNPAVLGTIDSGEVAATLYKHVLDVNAGTLAVTAPLADFGLRNNGTVAFGVNYVNYGQFQRSDRNGNVTGTFGGADIALSLAYANDLDSNWHYGIALKYISNRIDNAGAGAVAADVGMMYLIPKARVTLGVSVLHIGTQLVSINSVQEPLPLDVRLGVSHQLRGLPLLVAVSLNRLADPADRITERFLNFSLGGEFYIAKIINLRVGYEHQRRRELAPDTQPRISGFSGGVGVVISALRVDYALSSYGTVGNLHRIGVSWKF